MQRGLYQSKVTFSLAAIQRPGLLAHNCKMPIDVLVGLNMASGIARGRVRTTMESRKMAASFGL